VRQVGRGVKAGSVVTLRVLRSVGGVVVELITTFFLRLLRGRLVLVDIVLFDVISNSLSPVAVMSDAPVVVSRVVDRVCCPDVLPFPILFTSLALHLTSTLLMNVFRLMFRSLREHLVWKLASFC